MKLLHPDGSLNPLLRIGAATRRVLGSARLAQSIDYEALLRGAERGEMALRSEFNDDAWLGFAEMFAAVHGMVSKSDGDVSDGEVDLFFRTVEGEYGGAPGHVLASFDADPGLAREVLADQSMLVSALASTDGGAAALRAPDHLMQWVASSPNPEVEQFRTRLLRGFLVEVMYFGLMTGYADGGLDRSEFETWSQFGSAFGLTPGWLEQLFSESRA